MFLRTEYIQSLFNESANFNELALQLFQYQYKNNTLYRNYLDLLKIEPQEIKQASDIPYLPIGFFKTHEVKTGKFQAALTFESSGTTETTQSKHFVKTPSLYEQSFRQAFQLFYGDIKEYAVLGLLPSYLERENASLVYMVNDFIEQSQHQESGFYLNEFEKLFETLKYLEQKGQKTLLIGVTFGLLDFAERYEIKLENTIIMETGGMKGRRKEKIREEVHAFLKERFGLEDIHSEYGMTELLSQAYSKGKGIFHCPPWMKISLRDMNDPLSHLTPPEEGEKTNGLINIIDLTNIDSCAFIATDDIGILYPDQSFEVRGRRDWSDLRGCSLLVK